MTIRGADRLRSIAVAATGTDVVDLEACAVAGITVTNIRDYAVHTVPEHTFALILALRRSIVAYRESVARGRQEAGQFCYFDHPVRDLAGSTLGVIGDGSIGQAVAEPRQGVRHAHAVLGVQGHDRDGPAVHAVRGAAASAT